MDSETQTDGPTPVPASSERRRPLRVAYLAPSALLDRASGAAQSMTTLMAALAKAGVSCHALTGSCFDATHGAALPEVLKARGLKPKGRVRGTGQIVWAGTTHGFTHTMVHVQSQRRMSMTTMEEMIFRDVAAKWLTEVRPDVVITFGGMLLDIELQRLAQRAGAMVAFYLANPQYGRPATFDHVDLVMTNSAGTAALYKKRMGLPSHNIDLFVDPEPLRVAERKPEYVTFVNPQAEKGVTLFLKLVERAARDCPEMRFLVVESRATLQPALDKMKLPASIMDRITLLPRQEDMREVYRQTRILLMPSFWFEAAGRVLIEATANGIPVIATNRGGIPETLAGGGVLLEIPERCATDHWQVPDDAELEPWWSALKSLWEDATYYRQQSERALQAAATQSLEAKTRRVLALLSGALKEKHKARARAASLKAQATADKA